MNYEKSSLRKRFTSLLVCASLSQPSVFVCGNLSKLPLFKVRYFMYRIMSAALEIFHVVVGP
jgi:hypothetical protein